LKLPKPNKWNNQKRSKNMVREMECKHLVRNVIAFIEIGNIYIKPGTPFSRFFSMLVVIKAL
jgi:hypothetical protein